jgi:curved DNA-binding protein CbpA|tara:strand:- start:123 stop:800 length:678 start_codon:yes stop_codon:yes gene_type:complete
MAGGETDYYALLGVSKTADAKEIKRAFRKAALKYHPDVNKAADATTRFNEYKTAYNTLSNPDERRKYDILRAGGGFGAAWGGGASRSSWGAGTSSSSSPPRGYKPKEEEEFYGFGQFFEDMEKEWREFEKSRPDPGRPRTLWEELSALGEEFVDFLEEATPEVAEAVKDARARDPFDAYEATFRDDEKRAEGYARRGGAASSASPKKEDTVDDMLDALKRKMGKK